METFRVVAGGEHERGGGVRAIAGTCTAAVQFLSMDEVVKGDKVHTATASWHAAQDILHCPVGQQRKAVQFAKMSYDQLIQLHWLRVRDEPTTTLVVVEADNAEK